MHRLLHTLHTPTAALAFLLRAVGEFVLGRGPRRSAPVLRAAGLLVSCSLLLTVAAPAATPVPEPTVVVVGTTYRSPIDSSDWAYLSWLASDPSLLRDRSYAVYAKSGDADSGNAYALVSVVGVQTDPIAINALFDRSRHLGQDLTALRDVVAGYYREANPAGSLGTAEMFSYLAAVSHEDRNLFQMLTLLGRSHPGAALALGTGFAARVGPGLTTFELRECVSASGTPDANCTSVIGRVTVNAGQSVKLSAPVAPVKVPDVGRDGLAAAANDIKGHLNVKLRWATPDALRRQSLLVRGYNVYRVTRSHAEARGWDVCPASAALLALNWDAEVAASSPQVVKVNRGPIMMRRYYTTVEATDFDLDAGDGIKGDLEFYTQDDNRNNGLSFDAVGRPFDTRSIFVPGAQFYYYVVPVDLLGRNGTPSCGTLLTVCDRDPPPAPKHVEVTNTFSALGGGAMTDQRFRITWDQVPESTGDNVTAYYVYRWRSLTDLQQLQNVDPATLGPEYVVAGPLPHFAGKKTRSIDDNANPTYSPKIGADPKYGAAGDETGRTIWYTVRAVDNSSCGGNFSPNSSPAYGVLRDRAAPVGGTGALNVNCCRVAVTDAKIQAEEAPAHYDINRLHFSFNFGRLGTNPGAIVLAEFVLIQDGTGSEITVAQAEFPTDPAVPLKVDANIPFPTNFNPTTFTLSVRVYLDDGAASTATTLRLPAGPRPYLLTGGFGATRTCEPRSLTDVRGFRISCDHTPRDPVTGLPIPLGFTLEPAVGSREYRIYRTVDGGALTLVRQGTLNTPSVPGAVISTADPLVLPMGATLCYFVRYFDEHGNAGPLISLGCTSTIGLPPAVPVLGRPEPITPGGVPKIKLKWFEPPANVERFEIGLNDGGAVSTSISNALTPLPQNGFMYLFKNDDGAWMIARIFQTGIVGHNFPGPGPEFTVTLDNVDTSKTYRARIRAVGKNGMRSGWSNPVEFTWQLPETYTAPEVAWPARPLPTEYSASAWDSRITAEFLNTRLPGFLRLGVRIGSASSDRLCSQDVSDPENPIFALGGDPAPESYLYEDAFSSPPPGGSRPKLNRVMLYRYQVPNDLHPSVSGDIVQVTPLMESIAARRENPVTGTGCNGWRIYDPYIAVTSAPVILENFATPDLWLLDAQPFVLGARYRYLLVVFNEQGEIRNVIPTNEVDANF